MSQLVQNTLSAWALIETLQPGEVEGIDEYLNQKIFEAQDKQKVMHNFEVFQPIWEEDAYQLKPYAAKQGHIQFQMYRHCFKFAEIEKTLRQMFKEEEIYNESQKDCYGYTFMVDTHGNVLTDTIYVPMLMSAMKQIKKDQNAEIESKYEHHMERFRLECESILGDNPLTEARLHQMDQLYTKYFERYESQYSKFFQHAVAIRYVKPEEDMEAFNSFFLSDIEAAKASPNATLTQYIEGVADTEKTEIDENRALIEELLQPKYYPDGRWPSRVEHHLSLMQQVAVNRITQGASKVNSVNGPPGTGKTTLLKDIFAHHIVERAKEMVKLSSPYKAFDKRKIHDTDSFPTHFLHENLAQFKMVVASSNNGAVENITKDLPKIEEIIRKDDKPIFPEYERAYQEEVEKLSGFADIAEKIIEEPTWGLFSVALGKKKNIDLAMKYAVISKEESLTSYLSEQKENTDYKDWKEAKQAFKQTLDKITELKAEIEKGVQLNAQSQNAESKVRQLEKARVQNTKIVGKLKEELNQLKTMNADIDQALDESSEEIKLLNHTMDQEKNKGLFGKMAQWFNGDNQTSSHHDLSEKVAKLMDEREQLKANRKAIKAKQAEFESHIRDAEKRINQDENILEKLKTDIQKFDAFKSQHTSVQFSNDAFWAKAHYDKRQEEVLNMSDELQFYRGLLFIQAMVLHKILLILNYKSVQSGLWDFVKRHEYIKDKYEKVENAWNILHLVYPVVSTTFASFRNMYRDMPKDFIDYLYIDEAGQAVPQAAVGALQRSRHVVAVGDPIQIEPVVTLDPYLINSVRKAYNVPERLVSVEASVQSLADNANTYGYWKGTDSDEKEWIGIPLWVHRRCLNPMFDISNIIAYEEKMVLPSYMKKEAGQATWLDIKGKAGPKQYVKDQGEAVVQHLLEDWKHAKAKEEETPSVFVISPFTKVKSEIQKVASHRLKEHFDMTWKEARSWANQCIGTVHTFQGKEADKVYFVTGTDETQNGAIQWSCQKPNLINVAVTRAKQAFVIVGDKERISKLENYDVVANHVE
ncbi:DEAD/DEAH box helicase [Staphylococcus simulans]